MPFPQKSPWWNIPNPVLIGRIHPRKQTDIMKRERKNLHGFPRRVSDFMEKRIRLEKVFDRRFRDFRQRQ
jgi:hypothetical protein